MFALGPQEVTSARPVLGVNHFLTPKHTCPHLLCLLFLTIIKDATRVLLWKVTPKALHMPALGGSGGPALSSAESQPLAGTEARRRRG